MNLKKLEISSKYPWLNNLTLSLISSILLSLAWMGTSFIGVLALFISFVPILMLAERVKKVKSYLGYVVLTNCLWVVFTEFWIGFATFGGLIATMAVQSILFSIPFILYKHTLKHSYRKLALTLFASSWLALEFIFTHNSEVSHPWIMLGNGFADNIKLVQWYEYTGIFGGSLWVLKVNILILLWLTSKKISYFTGTIALILIPSAVSLAMYYNYDEDTSRQVSVSVIQPNIDPYNDKFGGLSQKQQDTIIQKLIMQAPEDVNYILTPETAVSDNINIDYPLISSSIRSYSTLINYLYPNSQLILGASMFRTYQGVSTAPTITARKSGNTYYDAINGALQISPKGINSHIKSKLVVGVEKLPFPTFFKSINIGGVNLGGLSGALLTSNTHSPLTSPAATVVVPICYESIYGEYLTHYYKQGAEAIFIITNDGWWRDTYGHRQHFNYARLRAIESRRSVARSANTGISGFINQRGDVLNTLGWDEKGILTSNISLNNKNTVYITYGDYLGRAACYLMLLSLLYFISYIYKKKSHLN